MGDLSSSEATSDCPPYEEGKTEIKRRFTVDHKFDHAGSFKIYIRLKHGNKEIAVTSTTIKLQPGGRIRITVSGISSTLPRLILNNRTSAGTASRLTIKCTSSSYETSARSVADGRAGECGWE